MPTVKATNLKDAEAMLYAGAGKVELAWDIGSDNFFRQASHWCERGAKISKNHNHFVVSFKHLAIPPNR